MRRHAFIRAFSLIEVIVAVALFAGAIAVILALVPGLTLRGREANERLVAQQLPDALQAELRRLAAQGLDALATRTPVMGMPPASGLAFVATHDGARLHAADSLRPTSGLIPEGEQYYLVECWRFPAGPLRFDAAQSAVALAVRVSWPYYRAGASTPTPVEARSELMFTVGVNR